MFYFFMAALISTGGALMFGVLVAIFFRQVVPTNVVHIVQSRKKTTSYGTGNEDGNVYYRWPSWVPRFGVTVIELPVSNFDLSLEAYEAYDKDRVPFMVDVASHSSGSTTQEAQRSASRACKSSRDS